MAQIGGLHNLYLGRTDTVRLDTIANMNADIAKLGGLVDQAGGGYRAVHHPVVGATGKANPHARVWL